MKKEQFNIHSQFLAQKSSRRSMLRLIGGLGLVTAGSGVTLGLSSIAKPAGTTPAATPDIHRFKVGTFNCVAINDGYSVLPSSFYAANAPTEQLESLLRDNGLPSDQVTNPSICLVIDTGQHQVLVDTGFGSVLVPGAPEPTGGKLQQNLRAAGIKPEDIDMVMITHAHPDHIGGVLNNAGKPAFPNARYVFWQSEWNFWTSEPSLSELGTGEAAEAMKEFFLTHVRQLLPPLRGHLRLVYRQVEIVPGIRAISAPGHTPGHMAVLVSSGNERLLHVGDAPGHYILSLEHPNWYLAVDLNPGQAIATRRWLLDWAAATRSRVFAYHFPFPGVGYVTKSRTENNWNWQPIGYS